jgi:hypothetical protein
MNTFAERYFPVDGKEFVARNGTWRCELDGPVDVSGVDSKIFHLRFKLKTPDWAAISTRTLELRTSLASFHSLETPIADISGANRMAAADHYPADSNPSYLNWLGFVISSFLETSAPSETIEAYRAQQGLNALTRLKTLGACRDESPIQIG